jgi:hypothetical protein
VPSSLIRTPLVGRSSSPLDAMERFAVLFPELLASFTAVLDAAGNTYLSNELRNCKVRCIYYNAEDSVATILLDSPRELNVVERRVIGERYETTISVSGEYMAHVDVDNFDRATSIQIVGPPAGLVAKLNAMLASNHRWSGRDA